MAVVAAVPPAPAQTPASVQTSASETASAIAAQGATPAIEVAAEAPVVVAVEVRVDEDLAADLEALVTLRPGEPLDPEAARRTLANFHATGLFSHVELVTRPGAAPGQVVAMVVAQRPPVIGRVVIEGESGLAAGRLRSRVKQRDGAVLDVERLEEGIRAIRELLEDRGHFEAEVRWSTAGSDVLIRVEAGPRAHMGRTSFSGDLGPYGGEDLRPTLRLRERYDPERIDESVERLRVFLAERGHLGAAVEAPQVLYDPEGPAVDLHYRVEAGPLYEVETRGVKRRWLERRGFLPLGERRFEEVLFEQGCARLRDHLQSQGHYEARVDCRIDQPGEGLVGIEAPDRRLVVEVAPGPVFEVVSIRFEGNGQISAAELEPLVRLIPRRRLRPGSGRLVSRDLDLDLENLRSYYLLQGFHDAEVPPARVEETSSGQLEVVIEIREGERRRVVGLEAFGVTLFPVGELLAKIPLEPGGGFHPLRLEDSLNVMRTLYEEEGHASAVVSAELDWNDERTLVDVTFTVEEGPRQTLDRLVLRGLQRTRPPLVNAYAGLAPGDVLSRRRLLEAERELYRLGAFSEVEVGLVPTSGEEASRNVSVRLEEGRRWRLSYGLSYHSDDGIGGLLGVSRNHLRGLGERLQLDIRASENDRRLRLFYDQPMLFGARLPLTWTLFLREEERESYVVEESGFRLAMTRELGDLRLGLLYDYRLVELEGEIFDASLLDREDQEVEISSWAPNVFLDRRDDPLDPTLGWSLAAQLEIAFPLAGADARFLKLFAQYTRYTDLGALGTLAASARLGLIEPSGEETLVDPILPPELASGEVPISERFFAGGRTTHRAYERDRLGILGQTLLERDGGGLIEAGGNGLFLLNVDWRFPIKGPVGGVAFLDVGNVWADWKDLSSKDLRPGLGLGVRYASPVGPVRLEIGWKLDPQDFEDETPVFLLSFGNPF